MQICKTVEVAILAVRWSAVLWFWQEEARHQASCWEGGVDSWMPLGMCWYLISVGFFTDRSKSQGKLATSWSVRRLFLSIARVGWLEWSHFCCDFRGTYRWVCQVLVLMRAGWLRLCLDSLERSERLYLGQRGSRMPNALQALQEVERENEKLKARDTFIEALIFLSILAGGGWAASERKQASWREGRVDELPRQAGAWEGYFSPLHVSVILKVVFSSWELALTRKHFLLTCTSLQSQWAWMVQRIVRRTAILKTQKTIRGHEVWENQQLFCVAVLVPKTFDNTARWPHCCTDRFRDDRMPHCTREKTKRELNRTKPGQLVVWEYIVLTCMGDTLLGCNAGLILENEYLNNPFATSTLLPILVPLLCILPTACSMASF